MINNDKPLVSIVVITYNSSKYILETLESAKAQSYDNIELIIADDGSNDETVKICDKWLMKNAKRFMKTSLIDPKYNSGIPANINRGLKKASGAWIKIIAGDDVLFKDAIENVIAISNNNPEIEILLTQIEIFNRNFKLENSQGVSPLDWRDSEVFNELTHPSVQFEYLLQGFHFPAPGFYIKHDLIKGVGYYDESFKIIEDIPFFLKILLKGKLIYFKPVVTVKYRKHSEALTAANNNVLQRYYLQYYQILYNFSKIYGNPKYITINSWNLFFTKQIFRYGNSGKFCRFLNKIRIYLNPRRAYSLFNI